MSVFPGPNLNDIIKSPLKKKSFTSTTILTDGPHLKDAFINNEKDIDDFKLKVKPAEELSLTKSSRIVTVNENTSAVFIFDEIPTNIHKTNVSSAATSSLSLSPNTIKEHNINKYKSISFEQLSNSIPRRRNIHELQSIFRRLDVNHDGELDINEFERLVQQMKLTDDEALINFAFAESDKDNSGKLCMQDFEVAYDILYRGVLTGLRNKSEESDQVNYVLKCLRYGTTADQGVVFEVTLIYTIKELELHMEKIALDNFNNRIRWWIDISIIKMNFAEKELVSKLLGISKNEIILSGVLPETRSSRMRSGADSVSFFVQTMWIKNIPLVHTHGEFASRFGMDATNPFNAQICLLN